MASSVRASAPRGRRPWTLLQGLGLARIPEFLVGEDLAAGGVLAVKVTVQNGSTLTYTLDPAAIELRPRGGSGKVTQLDIAEAAKAIARAAAGELDPGIPGPTAANIETTLRKRALTGGGRPSSVPPPGRGAPSDSRGARPGGR